MKYFRDILLESDEYKNVFDMPDGWWATWKDKHKDEYTLDTDEFKKTVDVKKGDELFFVYDKDRDKVFTDRPLADLLKESHGTYFKTFSEAVQHARADAEKRGFVVDDQDWFDLVTTGSGKPSEGKTFSASLGLTANGKPSNKRLSVQVYGMGSSYELNHYIA